MYVDNSSVGLLEGAKANSGVDVVFLHDLHDEQDLQYHSPKIYLKKNGSCNYLQAILSKPVLNNTYGMHYHTNHKTTFSPHLQSPCIPRKVYTQDMSNRRFA